MKPSFFLGIDPSLENTAVCVLDRAGKLVDTVQSKLLHLKSNKPMERLITLQSWLSGILDKYPAKYAGYENYSYNSTNKTYKLGELGGVLKTTLFSKAAGFVLIPPSVLKQFATGSGAADKDAMVAQALKECPELQEISMVTNDICDAYFLAKAALFVEDPKAAVASGSEMLRHRLEIIKKGKYEQFRRDD